MLIILLLLALLAAILIRPPRAYGSPSQPYVTPHTVLANSSSVPVTNLLATLSSPTPVNNQLLSIFGLVKPPTKHAKTTKHAIPVVVAKVAVAASPAPTAPVFDPNNPATWPTCPAGDIVRADNGQCAAAAVTIAQSNTNTVITAAPSSYTGNLASWLAALRGCESGGNYGINTGNGFYGAYQFTIATWNHWNTGYARADLAPAAVQDATIVENTNASSGGLATQNPGCYAKLGLSAFPPSN